MKIVDLVEGQEYAASRYSTVAGSHYATLMRVKLLRIYQRTSGGSSRSRKESVCSVRILAASADRIEHGVSVGQELELLPSKLWRPWSEQERINTERKAAQRAIETVRKALGRLGLHDSRRHRVDVDLRSFEVTLSGSELVKLADRADHLVELERIVHEQWTNDPVAEDGTGRMGQQILEWAEHHDFSMLVEGESDVIPSREEIEAEEP